MKKLGILFATIIMAMLFAVSASALEPTGQCGDNVYWNYDSTTGELIISGEGDMWDYSGETITPFYDSDIKKVLVDEGVTKIGASSFYSCYTIIDLEISDSVVYIGDGAFAFCDDLKNINFGNGVTRIGKSAFGLCNDIVSLTLSENTTVIEDLAFSCCNQLKEIYFSKKVTLIGDEAFVECNSLKDVFYGGNEIDWTNISIGENNIYLLNAKKHYSESNIYKVGDIIQFGSYPQSRVTDSATITALNNIAPKWKDWTNYGYYSGSGCDSMVQGDWMRYIDIELYGEKYRGVKFTQYRPDATIQSSYYYDYGNKYQTNAAYWFKFEPIDWRILDPNTGFVMCETIIDSQPYSNTIYYNRSVGKYFNDSSYTYYASDYETSSIRKWLNCDFYNAAFTDDEKKDINTTILNNDGYHTLIRSIDDEKLNSNETNDKIFLLSYDEVDNSNFGFDTNGMSYDKARRTIGSDYAKIQGLRVSNTDIYAGNSYWLLRSPGYSSSYCCYVDIYGVSRNNCNVYNSYFGIRPALYLENIKHKHSYYAIITPPDCTAQGYTTYTCNCGDIYIDNYVKENGHNHISKVTIPATHLAEGVETYTCHCGDTYTKTIQKLTAHLYNAVITNPTCTDKGYTTYACECGDSYVADYVDENGHSHISKITKEATHLAEGTLTYTCECGDTYNEPIAKLEEHSYVANVILPTCSEKGYTEYLCECGASYISDYVGMIAHSYVYTVVNPSSHLIEGLGRYTCSKCGDHYDESIAKTKEHSYTSTLVNSTCVSQGYTLSECECGDSFKSDYLAKTDHNDSNADGVCDNCGYELKANCSCNCHAGGIKGLIFKLILLFQKLFRMNRICEGCGVYHY